MFPLRTPLAALFCMGLLLAAKPASGQCTACEADPTCSSDNGFPTICPAALPAATVGVFYEETITFFLPAEVVDPGSGITAKNIPKTARVPITTCRLRRFLTG